MPSFHRELQQSRRLIAYGLVSTLSIALLLPGCVQSPRELIGQMGGGNATVKPRSDSSTAEAAPQRKLPDDSPLVKASSDTSIRLAGYRQNENPDTATSQTKELNTILQQRRGERLPGSQAVDPFLMPRDSKSQESSSQEAKVDRSRSVQEVAQSLPVPQNAKNRFSEEFDVRLEELRKQLDSGIEKQAALRSSDSGSNSLPSWASISKDASGSRTGSEDLVPGLFGHSIHDTQSPQHAGGSQSIPPESPVTGIASGRPFESLSPTRALNQEPPAVTDPAIVTTGDPVESATWNMEADQTSRFAEGASHSVVTEQGAPVEPISSTGGVVLLPPVDDSFQSTREERALETLHESGRSSESVMRAIARLANASADRSNAGRRLEQSSWESPDHHSPRNEQAIDSSANGESTELAKLVAARDRTMWSGTMARPSIPEPVAVRTEQEHSEPIEVAPPPPFLLEVDLPGDTGEAQTQTTPSLLVGKGGASFGAPWRSLVIWCIGGLILLMTAMRLMTRRIVQS